MLSCQGLDFDKAPSDPEARFRFAKELKDLNCIGLARRVLETTATSNLPQNSPLRINIIAQLANCTAKDQDLPADERLRTAQVLLENLLLDVPDMPLEEKQDALGILGAVHKQRWSIYGLREHLEKALVYYEAGYRLGPDLKYGSYTGINASFVLDLLAQRGRQGESEREERLINELAARSPDPEAENAVAALHVKAAAIRRNIITALLPEVPKHQGDYWFYSTLGEAYLGLEEYDEARQWMEKAAALGLANWKWETTARQIGHLARIKASEKGIAADAIEKSEAWKVVRALLGDNDAAALSFFRGKVGLALSGGGFRASLYHIGVLARLAELDVLRHVEVISCVSGGSILGAYYYLKLKKLLERTPDDDISREDYIRLVSEIERDFLAGVQKNLRMRMLAGFKSNLKVLSSTQSSTSQRLGDLYESELYAPIIGKPEGTPCYIDDLKVMFPDQPNFNPKYDNWRRRAKVPILVLNATTLNTCHNWQFTATYMGEPPANTIDHEIDGNDRLRRMWYFEAPPAYRNGAKRVRLGRAVAASACVPGLFDPLVLDDLYQQNYVTRLVDGGVFDNQGVASLSEQDCRVLLVSDASGQTGIVRDPAAGALGVALRTNNVLMARVRQAEYQLLASLHDSCLLRGLMYVHLKKGLETHPVDWIGEKGEQASAHAAKCALKIDYHILSEVQRRLALIRTDLDSFSDTEADALMLSGYRMTELEFPRGVPGFPVASSAAAWRFLQISGIAEGSSPGLEKLTKTLDVAHCEAFKRFRLWPGFHVLEQAVKGAEILLGLLALWALYAAPQRVSWVVLFLVALLAIVAFVTWIFRRWKGYRNPLWQVLLAGVVCSVGWIYLPIHLRFIDPVYLRSGPKYRKNEPAPPHDP